MFRIANPENIWFLAAVPAVLLLYIIYAAWKKKALRRFGEDRLVSRLLADASTSKPWVKMILALTGLALLALAAMRPQVGSRLEEVKRKGVDVMIAIDVSNSMNTEDIRPTRLERSRRAVLRMIDQLQGDRIGLVIFAGDAYVQLPITTDYGAAKLFLNSISTDMVPTQGTAIGAAIEKSMDAIGDSSGHNAAIVIITDGENHEDDAIEAAKEAAGKGIIVHTIGMGTAEGAPVPLFQSGRRVGYMKDKQGTTVISQLDGSVLQQIADAGKGKYIRASNADDGVEVLLKEIAGMEKKEFASKLFTDYDDQFQYVLLAALFFILLEFLITEHKSEWFRKLDIFGVRKSRTQKQ